MLFIVILFQLLTFLVLGNIIERQESTIKQWEDFENEMDILNNWLKVTEVKFREQPLQATLAEKENCLKKYFKDRDLIAEKEKEVDAFVDNGHSLLLVSGVQKIKPLISQINNRYQNLHALSKEVINKWQSLVDNHRNYENKMDEISAWLEPLEEHLAILETGELADNIEAKSNRLQVLLSEREQGEHKINSLTLIGERLFPDTAAPGREKIRNDLRSIRDRWDKLEEGIKGQQKLQDAQSLQLSSYQEMLQQTLAWLDSMEKLIQPDSSTWISIQEVRAKLLKHRTTMQEILSHKRIIEGITEKAQALVKLSSSKESTMEVEENVKYINNKYKELVKKAQSVVKQLEDCLNVYQNFYDLQKAHQDYQKQLWDKLQSYTDYSGNKQALEERLNKVIEIQDHLSSEGTIKLNELKDHVENKVSAIPARAQEQMQRDVANLQFDLDKFVASLSDVKYSLEDRIKQWNDYESSLDRLLSWLADAELTLKNYALKATVEEKQEQLEKYQVKMELLYFSFPKSHRSSSTFIIKL